MSDDDDDDGGDDGDDQVSDDEDDQTMWVPIIGNGFGNKGINLKSFFQGIQGFWYRRRGGSYI